MVILVTFLDLLRTRSPEEPASPASVQLHDHSDNEITSPASARPADRLEELNKELTANDAIGCTNPTYNAPKEDKSTPEDGDKDLEAEYGPTSKVVADRVSRATTKSSPSTPISARSSKSVTSIDDAVLEVICCFWSLARFHQIMT